jgi:hypothetical protein
MAISSDFAGPRRPLWLVGWAGPLVVCLVFAVAGLFWAEIGVIPAKAYFGEDGLVEVASPIILSGIVALYLVWMVRVGLTSFVPPVVLVLMTWREFDGDKWFTAKSVLSSGFYFDNPGTSYGERILVAAILTPLALMIIHLFWRQRFAVIQAVREFQPYCRSMIVAFAMLGASLVLDGLPRKVFAISGFELSHFESVLSGLVEETSEFAMALAFLVALLQLRFDPRHNVLPGAGGETSADGF